MEGNQRELEGIISRLGRVRELLVWMEGFFGDGILQLQTAIERLFRETNIQEKLQCVNVPNTVVENTSGSKPARTRTHIFNFPNEIISSIFEHGFVFPEHISKKSDPLGPMKVTWVCRRFRQIALDTSCIWSGVSSLLPERVLDLHIERSKEILLSLAIHPNHVPGMGSIHSHRLLDATLSLTCRWESFSLLCDLSESWMSDIGSRTKGIYVPRLTNIVVDCDISNVDANGEFERAHFFESWRTPSLRRFTAKGVIPRLMQAPCLASFNITLESTSIDWSAQQLLLFLKSCPSLTELSIILDNAFLDLADCPNVTLPSVNLLHIGLSYNICDNPNGPFYVEGLLGHLCLPQLERLSLKLQSLPLDQIRVCLDCVLAEPEKSPKLTELQLDINLESLNSPLEPIFSNLKQIERVGIRVSNGLDTQAFKRTNIFGTDFLLHAFNSLDSGATNPGPGSRHIYLEGLSSLTPFLRVDIFNNIQRNPNWSQFERYRVLELSPLLQHSREMVRLHRTDEPDRMIWARSYANDELN